jgi:hypothetical protein
MKKQKDVPFPIDNYLVNVNIDTFYSPLLCCRKSKKKKV